MGPQRIVCLAAEIPAILHRLGALERVVGISAYTREPEEALAIPKVSGFKHGSAERIRALEPDLAILTSDVQKDLAHKLADAGVPVLHLHPRRFDDLYPQIELLGNLVGRPQQAAALNEELRSEVGRIREQAEKFAVRPSVYFEEWHDPMLCGTAWVSDLIGLAGGRDLFRERSLAGRKADQRMVRPEEILEADPDLVLASWCGKPFDRSAFVGRDGFAGLSAVRRETVFEVDSRILQFGPMLVDSLREVQRLIGIAADGGRQGT